MPRDLLVIVDDTALDVGRARLRATGSAGGHNGLKSVEAALGTRDYARLRIGVGAPPPGVRWRSGCWRRSAQRMSRWWLDLLPDLVDAVHTWIVQGVAAAANRCNR
jgi:peptidyl-tRNA hydrolase, PTH1 family